MARTKITDLKVRPRYRAAGSPKGGEKNPNKEDLRKLMLAMNPDAEQIEEAAAAAPRIPEMLRRAGKGFYEEQVAPFLSPIETAKGLLTLGKEFATSPVETGRTVARSELERLKEAGDKPESAAEYAGGLISPFGVASRVLKRDVVRPKNEGLVLNEPGVNNDKLVLNPPLGYTGNYLKTARDSVEIAGRNKNLPKEQIDAINEFFDRKAKNYFVKQIGTSDDPVFNAIKQGRLTTPALREPGGIPSYMVRGAQVGKSRTDPATGRTRFYPSAEASEALRDMTAVYDRMTGMRGTVFANQTIGSPEYETLVRDDFRGRQPEIQARITDKLIQEGVSPNQITEAVDFVGYKDPRFFKEGAEGLFKTNFVGDPRNPSSGTDIVRMLSTKPEQLPKTLATSIAKGDVIYDMRPTGALSAILQPSNIIDYLATLPPEKIKNIRFEDAVIGSAKLREKADIKAALFRSIRENKPVPNEVFLRGVSDPVLTFPKESPFAGYTWRRVVTPEAAEIEGAYIGHSVGGYSETNPGMVYDEKKRKNFAEGTAQVYSLRDPRGRPVTTIEVAAPPGERPVVSQVKGAGRATGNKMPEQFDVPVTAFLEFLSPSRVIESDQYLPPMAKAFKEQVAKPGPLRASIGRGQPIGNADVANDFLRRVAEQDPDLAARAAANPQMLEDALRRRAEALQPPPQVREGIGQLPNAPQNLPNEGFVQAMLRRLRRDED